MRPRDRVAAILAFVALAVAVLAVGGAMRWAQGIVAILVALALLPQLRSRSTPERLSPLVAILAAAAALTTLQLVPLPSALLAHLDATGQELRTDGAELLDLSPWHALTGDAPATLRALGGFFILLGFALVALRFAATERGRYRLVAGVAAVCTLTAFVVLVHKLVGAKELYGVYAPKAAPAVLGPLLNENHLGGLMAIGATCAMGLAVYRRQAVGLRVAWLVAVGACGAVTALSQSRGAILALFAGLFVAAAVLLGQRFSRGDGPRRKPRFVTSALPIGVVAASAIVIVVYSTAGGLQRELDRTSFQEVHAPTSKFAAWQSSTKLVEEAPILGIGRGAMESRFTRVHPSSGFVTFSHLENEYLQTVVDFGIVGTLILGACSLWLVSLALRRWRDGPITAAALGGITCVLLQSSVDFGVELVGLAIPVTILIAAVTYVPLREPSRPVLLRARASRIGLIVVLVTTAVTLFTSATTTLDEDREALSARRASLKLPEIQASLTRHPLDYYGYALAADVMVRGNDTRAIKLLNHAMRLHPTHPGLHRVAARVLLRTGHEQQATLEYAAALRYTSEPSKLLGEIVLALPTARAVASIPTDLTDLYTVVRALRDLKQPQVAALWLDRVLAVHPHSTRACELWFDVVLQGADAPLHTGKMCLERVPDRQTQLQLAQVLVNKQRYDEVIGLLSDVEAWTGRIDMRAQAWLTLCDVRAVRRDYADAKRCLRRLDASGDLTPDQRPAIEARLAQLEKDRRAEDLAHEQIRRLFFLK